MRVATAFPDDEHRCESCGCAFRIVDSNAPPNYCPACGTQFHEHADINPRHKGRGKRLTRKEQAKQKRDRLRLHAPIEDASEQTGDGSSLSDAIQNLVDNEDKRQPFTDDNLVDLLKELGFNVARRTVTKTRKKLGIPSSRQRRDWKDK